MSPQPKSPASTSATREPCPRRVDSNPGPDYAATNHQHAEHAHDPVLPPCVLDACPSQRHPFGSSASGAIVDEPGHDIEGLR